MDEQKPTPKAVMALNADQILEKIGSFGRYQLRLIIMANILGWFWFAWPLLVTTFIAAEPGWRCVVNSSECKLNGTANPGDDNFDLRCDMSRDDWEFVDDYTSVVTEVTMVTIITLGYTSLRYTSQNSAVLRHQYFFK